jgi:hypothetical protein
MTANMPGCSRPPEVFETGMNAAVVKLAEAAANGGRPARAPRASRSRCFGKHPRTEAEIKLMEGRYGAYVTDGETNATLPKSIDKDQLTLEEAAQLIDARAAAGPPRARARRRPRRRRSRQEGTRQEGSGQEGARKEGIAMAEATAPHMPPAQRRGIAIAVMAFVALGAWVSVRSASCASTRATALACTRRSAAWSTNAWRFRQAEIVRPRVPRVRAARRVPPSAHR